MSYEGIKMGRIPKIEKEKVFQLNSPIECSHELKNFLSLNKFPISDQKDESFQLISPNYYSEYFLNNQNQVSVFILSSLKDRCYTLFSQYNLEFRIQYENIKRLLSNGFKIEDLQNSQNIPFEIVRKENLKKLKQYIKTCILYGQDVPGFDKLDIQDFQKVVINRIFIILGLLSSKLFINNEYYLPATDNVYFTRSLMEKIIGKELTEQTLAFYNNFSLLNLSDFEIAVLIPFILTSPSKYKFIKYFFAVFS